MNKYEIANKIMFKRVSIFMIGIAVVTFAMAFSPTAEAREYMYTLHKNIDEGNVVYVYDL